MFIIKDRAPQPDPSLIELLRDVETATVGHFYHHGFMDQTIRPVFNNSQIVGPAVTVKTAGADSTVVHKVMEMIEPGDVVVVDRCGDQVHACWGGVVTLAARMKQAAGGIVDGPATDTNEIVESGFPFYCRGTTALTTKLLGFGGEINTVIQCGRVTVHPGDLIVADGNGILVLRPDEAPSVAQRALAMQEEEKKLIERLKAGEDLPAITRAGAIITEKSSD